METGTTGIFRVSKDLKQDILTTAVGDTDLNAVGSNTKCRFHLGHHAPAPVFGFGTAYNLSIVIIRIYIR